MKAWLVSITCVGMPFHEGQDLESQVEAYLARYGVYPKVVLGDLIYDTRDNRRYLNSRGIRFARKPLARLKKFTAENQETLRQEQAKRRGEYFQRILIEGKFGQGKNGCRLNYIRAKRADTSVAWINSIFLVMNLLILLRIFCALCKTRAVMPSLTISRIRDWFYRHRWHVDQTHANATCKIMVA